jgi:hypothetical protein
MMDGTTKFVTVPSMTAESFVENSERRGSVKLRLEGKGIVQINPAMSPRFGRCAPTRLGLFPRFPSQAASGDPPRDRASCQRRRELDGCKARPDHFSTLKEAELIAQEVSSLAEKISALQQRLDEVERVNGRLEQAALITARALQEISGHWDAAYEAMRREEPSDDEEP